MNPTFWTLLPFMILLGGAVLLYLVSRFANLGNKTEAVLTVAILVVVILTLIQQGMLLDTHASSYLSTRQYNLQVSLVGVVVMVITCISAIPICVYSGEYLAWDRRSIHRNSQIQV